MANRDQTNAENKVQNKYAYIEELRKIARDIFLLDLGSKAHCDLSISLLVASQRIAALWGMPLESESIKFEIKARRDRGNEIPDLE